MGKKYKGYTIPVLDNGYVKLVDWMGEESSIIEAARMSTNKGFQGWEKDQRLLEYLYKNRHSTPFEMCEMIIEVQAPIFVIREWHRHRTQSYNELSARYTKMPDLHYLPELNRFQAQSTHNKQSSAEPLETNIAKCIQIKMHHEQIELYNNYTEYLKKGLAREVARINTPVSRYSKMRAKSNLRNWLHFLGLRLPENAQWEIRQYAEAVANLIEKLWPRTYKLFLEYDLNKITLSKSEAAELRKLLATQGITDKPGKHLRQVLHKLGIN